MQKIAILLAVILVTLLLTGCHSTISKKQFCEDPQLEIAFEYSDRWKLETGERLENLVVLESKGGLLERGSARIEILVGFPVSRSIDLQEGLDDRISNKARLYELDSITVIQSPTVVEEERYQIAMATISIPTTSMPAGSPRNQMGGRDTNSSQIIDMYTIRNDDNNFLEVTIYQGNSQELNAEAEEIVNSIDFING